MGPEELASLGLSQELVVIVVSMLPVAELRGALPVAINIFHFPWYYALLLALVGNLLPVPFLLLLFDVCYQQLSRIAILDRAFNRFFGHVRRRGAIIERYERIGLALFVAVPLPVTGAWTGAIAAVIFGLGFRRAFISILAGVFIAGAIVTTLCLLGWVGAAIAGVALSALAAFSLWKA